MLCESGKRTSMMVALAVTGGGGRIRTADSFVKRSPGSPVGQVMQWTENSLGKDARAITNKAGDKVFTNVENTKRVRFDVNNPHGDKPHVHIESKQGGRWQDYTDKHRIYPIVE